MSSSTWSVSLVVFYTSDMHSREKSKLPFILNWRVKGQYSFLLWIKEFCLIQYLIQYFVLSNAVFRSHGASHFIVPCPCRSQTSGFAIKCGPWISIFTLTSMSQLYQPLFNTSGQLVNRRGQWRGFISARTMIILTAFDKTYLHFD